MSGGGRSRKRSKGGGGGGGGRPGPPVDLWRPVPEPPPAGRITPADDPTAVLHSLGPPPLPGQGASAEHYLAAVIERTARLATAVAAASGLLDQADDDVEEGEDDERG